MSFIVTKVPDFTRADIEIGQLYKNKDLNCQGVIYIGVAGLWKDKYIPEKINNKNLQIIKNPNSPLMVGRIVADGNQRFWNKFSKINQYDT